MHSTIDIFGRFAIASADLTPLIAAELSIPEHLYGRSQWQRRDLRFFEPCDDNRISIPAGCVDRIVGIAVNHGLAVDVRNPRSLTFGHRMARSCSLDLQDLNLQQIGLLIQTRHSGAISVSHEAQKAQIVELFAEIYPASRTLVVVVNNEARQNAYRSLLRFRPGVAIASRLDWQDECRIVVCTATMLSSVNDQDWDFVVFWNAGIAAQERMDDVLRCFDRHRMWALFGPHERLDRRQALSVESLTGPVVFSWPGTTTLASVEVRFVPIDCPPGRAPERGALSYKRLAIWQNEQRNVEIAKLAQSLVAGDLMGTANAAGSPSIACSVPRIVVLVETPEHGEHLARQMPDWTLTTCQSRYGFGIPARQIMTMAAALRLGQLSADIVVRADGGVGGLELPTFPPPLCSLASTASVLLVDIDDDFDERSSKNALSRHASYQDRGFRVIRSPLAASQVGEASRRNRARPRHRSV